MASEKTPDSEDAKDSSSLHMVKNRAAFGSSLDIRERDPRNPLVFLVDVDKIKSNVENPSSRFPFLNVQVDNLAKTKKIHLFLLNYERLP